MRRLAWLVVCGLACGCGGGGSGAEPSSSPVSANPPAATALTIEDALSGCSTQNVQEAIDFLQAVGTACEAGDTSGMAITGFNVTDLSLSWSLDGDRDGTPEATGTVRFVDAAGLPSLPIDLQAVAEGTATSADLFVEIPDGTRALFTFDLLRFVDGAGDLDVEFLAGQPSLATGAMTLSDGTCSSDVSCEGFVLPATPDAFPDGVIAVEVHSGADGVDGTISFDGTNLALLQGTVNGGAPQQATLDLSTGKFL